MDLDGILEAGSEDGYNSCPHNVVEQNNVMAMSNLYITYFLRFVNVLTMLSNFSLSGLMATTFPS